MYEIFNSLISPFNVNEFNERYLAQKAMHIKGNPEKFNDLFNWEALNHLLSTTIIPYTHFSLATMGKEVKIQPTGNFTVSNILNDCMSGSTLHIRSIHEFNEKLQNYFFNLSKELKALIIVNIYASAPEHQALNLHFDDHDIFIFQVEGTKKWKVYPPGYPDNDIRRYPEKTYMELDMKKGDILYVPTGHWHVALASTPSMHLAVATEWLKGTHFFNWINKKLNPGINEFFPLLPAEKHPDNFLNGWKNSQAEINKLVLEKIDDSNLINEIFREARLKVRGSGIFNFPYHYFDSPVTDLETQTFFRPESSEAVITDEGILYLYYIQLNFEKNLLPLIRFIFNNRFFSGSDLLKFVPGINQEQLTETLNFFVKEGLIRIQ